MEEFSTYGLWFQSLHEIWQRKVFHVRYYDFRAHLSSKSFITSLMTHSSHHLSTMTCKKWIFFYLCCCLLVCSPYAFTYRNFVVPPYVVHAGKVRKEYVKTFLVLGYVIVIFDNFCLNYVVSVRLALLIFQVKPCPS